MSELNLHPVHKSFQNLGSDSTHTTSYSPYSDSIKAFQNFTSFDSDSTHSSSRESGFQYVQSLITLTSVSASGEVVNTLDQSQITYILLVDEVVNAFVGVGTGRPRQSEEVPVLDECVIVVIKAFQEVLDVTDVNAKTFGFESTAPILDQSIITIIVLCTETLPVLEQSDAYMRTDVTDTVQIRVSKEHVINDTVKITFFGQIDVTDSVNVGIIPETFTSVISASGFSSVVATNPIVITPGDPSPVQLPTPGEVTPISTVNPFRPTIIIGGVIIAYDPLTAPPGYP